MEQHFESLYPSNSRQREIGKILTCIKSGNFSQIISLTGAEMSNLLRLFAYNKKVRIKHLGDKEKSFHFVMCSFAEISNKPIASCLKFLLLSLMDSLEERRLTQEQRIIEEMVKKTEGSDDELIIFHELKRAIEYITLERDIFVVFLFDKFEDYIPMLNREFFAYLRILRNNAKYKFSVVFGLERPLENLADPSIISDIFEFIADHKTYLAIYDKAGTNFRIPYIEEAMGKKLDKKIHEKILELTGGHGKLTRICTETLLETDDKTITSSDIKEILFKQKSVQSALSEIWNSLTPAEQNILASGKLAPVGQLEDDNITFLTNIEILKTGKITIKLLEDFIKVKSAEKTEKIIFDPATKDIKKGEIKISDYLTHAEYEALKFLVLNHDRVIDREEIINAVWKESKSTAGVTDEALDQLIFRLRHKIEKDPNNPKRLLTVKGRGFRFTP